MVRNSDMTYTDRQIEIIQNATQLIGEKGIQNFTTKNLAKRLSLTEPSIYRHFKNKDEILFSMLHFFQLKVETTFGQIIANSENGIEKIQSLIQFQFNHFAENPALAMVIMAENILKYLFFTVTFYQFIQGVIFKNMLL